MLVGIGFRSREFSRLVVLHVSPRETIRDHFHVDEPLAQINPAHLPAIAVDVDHVDSD